MIDFRAEYIARRDAHGLSDYRVAQVSGVPRASISDFCRGKSALGHESLARILAAVGATDLLPRVKAP